MKRIVLMPMMFGLMSNAMATTCQYPLDATSQEYYQYDAATSGQTDPFPSINNQIASLTIAPTSSAVNYIAFSSAAFNSVPTAIANNGYIGDITLPSTGIVAFEFKVDDYAVALDANDGVVLSASFSTVPEILNTAGGFSAEISLYSNAGNTIAVLGGFSDGITYSELPITLSSPLPSNIRFGIYLNMSTRRIGYTLNGTDMGYVTNEQPMNSADLNKTIYFGSNVQNIAVLAGARTYVASTSSIVGATVGGTLIMDSSQFTQPFPSGTKDICGNPVP